MSRDVDDLCRRACQAHVGGDSVAALKMLDAGVAEYPESADIHELRGVIQYALRQFGAAVTSFTAAIQTNPAWARYYCERGGALAGLGSLDLADQDYTMALKLGLFQHWVFNNRGIVRARLGRLREAESDYDSALMLSPGYALSLFNRAQVKRRLGRVQDAVKDLGEAIDIDPQYFEAYLVRGGILAASDLDAATMDIKSAIRIAPGSADARVGLARVKYLGGNYEEALADCDMAIALDGRCPLGHYYRGLINVACGNSGEAFRDFGRAVQAEPNDSELGLACACQLLAAGFPAEARMELRRVLSIDPGNVEASGLLRRLQNE